MQAGRLAISIVMFTPRVFTDARGFFFESFHQQRFTEATGVSPEFVQDNLGLALRERRVARAALPVASDGAGETGAGLSRGRSMRRGRSPPRLAHLRPLGGGAPSADNRRQLWIPEGFAHGFITLSDSSEVLDKATRYYAPGNWNAASPGTIRISR